MTRATQKEKNYNVTPKVPITLLVWMSKKLQQSSPHAFPNISGHLVHS
jgi:hypothetical protein